MFNRSLAAGGEFPAIGVGTFGSDRYDAKTVGSAVEIALRLGYRLVDCAAVYGNEAEVGRAIERVRQDLGLERSELKVMSKVWNDSHPPDRVVASVEQSLKDLRLDYLDTVFIHWPFPNHHAPKVDVESRDPAARPYSHRGFMAAWRALESLVDDGRIRHLGVSNVTIPKLTRILADARIKPTFNEMELHPTFQQAELFQFSLDHGIQPVGYAPLGSPSRPERDRAEDDLVDLDSVPVRKIAERLGLHPAQVCLKWAVTRGQIPIPFAVKEDQLRSNLAAVTGEPLTPEEIDAMRGVERNCRLIKGQVFVWPGAGSWLDLWDVDGSIPGWGGYGSPTLE